MLTGLTGFLPESTLTLYDNLEFLFRILLSAALGAAIGLERTKRQKEAGVRTRRDVELQDEKRRQEKRQKTPSGQENGLARETARRRTPNQFHNFKQRDTDYETLMLQQVKERVQGE